MKYLILHQSPRHIKNPPLTRNQLIYIGHKEVTKLITNVLPTDNEWGGVSIPNGKRNKKLVEMHCAF